MLIFSNNLKAPEDNMVHRTFKTLEPKGEVAVAQRPEGVLKLVVYTGSGAKKEEHFGLTLDRHAAFDLAMEILQHAYRLGAAGK
jgi:hypothetical protein